MSAAVPGSAVQRALWFALLGAVLLPGFGAAGDHSGLLVLRRVVARDVVTPPATIGIAPGGRECPPGVAVPVDGDEIRLWVAPGMARRDEPRWSAILRLEPRGKGVAYLLFHGDRTFAELRLPVPPKRLWNPMRRDVAKAGEGRLFALTAQGPVDTSNVAVNGISVEERRLTTRNGFGHRRDFELQVLNEESAGGAGLALEGLVQAIRSGGDDWVAMTGAARGVPAGLVVTNHLPDTTSRYAEQLVASEATAISADRFAVPAGYSKVPFAPECF